MAIENIWIIDSNSGICIYDWCTEFKEKTIDEQLVSGLLLAFRSFSSEAGLVDISAIEGINRKLAYQADDRFIIASICHTNDYEPLVNKTLQGLLADFRKKYKHLIDEDSTTDVSPFRTFHEDLETKLEGTTATRSTISLIAGAIITMMLVGVIYVIYFFTNDNINALLPESGNILNLIIVFIGYFVSGAIGGLIAGDRRYGIFSGIVASIPTTGVFIIFLFPEWMDINVAAVVINSILYLILFLVLTTAGGIIGGYRREQRYLYPLDIEEEIAE
ncbi:MAG: YrzE family protein [Candidatus Heimdallarchaeota archaeon]|nr:YrzE family protein [Candidatus Heimdallarchaeota archaeon]MCK4291011.1 YrzE family protein [Candidatus Heimdallarchaeota archaeon]